MNVRLIFIDESARDNRYYFFGALIADASAVRMIEDGMNGIARLIAAHHPSFKVDTEFHGVDIFHGRLGWKSLSPAWRVKACELVSKVIARSSARFIFRGTDLVRHRECYENPYPAHLLTLAHLLEELHFQLPAQGDQDKLGLVLADEHHMAPSARRSLRHLKAAPRPGYTTGTLDNIADTIYFGPSNESRLLQATDVATYFLNRNMTITERDLRAQRAVERIVKNIRLVTDREYIWRPKTQRPA